MAENIYDRYCSLRDKEGYKDADVSIGAQITKSTFSDWKNGRYTPKADKLQKIADFFGVTLDYLMTGKKEGGNEEIILNLKDERDITKDLHKMIADIRNDKNGPLYYNGEEIDEASLILLENALEHAMRKTKKINKQRFERRKDTK